MVSTANSQTTGSELSAAISRIHMEIVGGLQHGFFSFKVTGEIINGKKRKVIVEAGKKYQFVIPEEDVAE